MRNFEKKKKKKRKEIVFFFWLRFHNSILKVFRASRMLSRTILIASLFGMIERSFHRDRICKNYRDWKKFIREKKIVQFVFEKNLLFQRRKIGKNFVRLVEILTIRTSIELISSGLYFTLQNRTHFFWPFNSRL